MAEGPPFTGEYPTYDEACQALAAVDFADEAETVVYVPMDGSTGPLAKKLTECKSASLVQNWPNMFKVVVGQMVKRAGSK